ncbi:hypothetical protein U1Q18_013630 [Sarracenia purpurea var. burkii]
MPFEILQFAICDLRRLNRTFGFELIRSGSIFIQGSSTAKQYLHHRRQVRNVATVRQPFSRSVLALTPLSDSDSPLSASSSRLLAFWVIFLSSMVPSLQTSFRMPLISCFPLSE